MDNMKIITAARAKNYVANFKYLGMTVANQNFIHGKN
jgi:hypothetical protein